MNSPDVTYSVRRDCVVNSMLLDKEISMSSSVCMCVSVSACICVCVCVCV